MKFKRRELEMSSDKAVALNIWGITGRENFRRVLRPYCRGVHGVVVFFDMADDSTFKCTKKALEKHSGMLSELSVPVWVVEVSESKKEKPTVPQRK